ncbi:MAG: hypothetical protein QM778_20230 [Myxococcales bacterium]
MKHADLRSPDWLGADDPMPLEVLDAIRVADREDGTAAQVASLEARLAPIFQVPQSSPGTPVQAGAGTGGSLSALKLLGVSAALVGFAALVWPSREAVHPPAAVPTAKLVPIVPAPAPSIESASPVTPQVAQIAAVEMDQAPTSPAGDPAPVAESNASRRGARPASAASEQSPSQKNTLALEARLLSRARQVLENDPALALKLAERHLARFPAGVLSEEREAIAIKALRRAGNEGAAAQRQARFLTRYPESPHAHSLSAGARP